MSPKIFQMLLVHQRLDRELQSERTRVWPDISRVQKLKKLKLAVKDRLLTLSTRPRRAINA
jgi:uncharacterized protein